MPARALFYMVWGPLWQRLKRGEGALLGVAFMLLVAEASLNQQGVFFLLAATWLLTCLYGFNDWRDAECDLTNPKKNQVVVGYFLQYQRLGLLLNLLLTASAIVLVFWSASGREALLAVCISVVNVAYSLKLKTLPLIDVLSVGMWGGLFTALFSNVLAICILIGLFTAVSHVFQAETDRDVDKRQHVNTIATTFAPAPSLIVGLCTFASLPILATRLAIPWLVFALAPLLLRGLNFKPQMTWLCVKATYAVSFAAFLGLL